MVLNQRSHCFVPSIAMSRMIHDKRRWKRDTYILPGRKVMMMRRMMTIPPRHTFLPIVVVLTYVAITSLLVSPLQWTSPSLLSPWMCTNEKDSILWKYPSKQRLRVERRNRCITIASNTNNENNDNNNDRNSSNSSSSSSSECESTDSECLFDEMEQETDPIRKQQMRMSMVRSIQNSFYASSSSSSSTSSSTTSHDSNPTTTTTTTTSTTEPSQTQQHPPPTQQRPTLDNGGMIEELLLWRVPWIELIGRTNVLFVHDAIYTNMFEELIRHHHQQHHSIYTNSNSDSNSHPPPPPILFGHVYLPPGGNQHLRSDHKRYKLQSWKDYLQQSEELKRPSNNHMDETSIIGTLMKINDYRRMNDGKLILYVQAIERFIVTQVHQTVPYGIIDGQLLPDQEEIAIIDKDVSSLSSFSTASNHSDIPALTPTITEDIVRPIRARAIVNESWNQWFPYEYSNRIGLPIPPPTSVSSSSDSQSDVGKSMIPATTLSMTDIVGCALAKVVPFAPLDPQQLPPIPNELDYNNNYNRDKSVNRDDIDDMSTICPGIQSTELPVEVQLMQRGIFMDDSNHPTSDDSIDDLEHRLWITLNSYYLKSNTAISPFVLSLLPPSGTVTWPKGFLLEGIASVMERNNRLTSLVGKMKSNDNSAETIPSRGTSNATTTAPTEFVRVPSTYPSIRRQKRCSYYIAQILESLDIENVQLLRHTLLRIPSTKQRLSYVLAILENAVDNFR